MKLNPPPVDYKYVQGSCYFNERFIDGRITLNTGQTFESPVRYDIFADQIEYKNEANEIFTVQNREIIRTVYIDSLQFKYFIMDPDDNFTEITSKKDLLIPGRDTEELEKFIKANKIKPKDEKDLIRFTGFLNGE